MKADIAIAKILKFIDHALKGSLVVTSVGSSTTTETNSAAILAELGTVDSSINNIKSTPTIMATHWSPTDFTAAYTSIDTIILSGHQDLSDSSQIRGIKVVRADNTSEILVNGAGVTMTYLANVITVVGLTTNFSITDVFEVGINYQDKAYDSELDTEKNVVQNPLWKRYTQKEPLVTAQDLTAAYANVGSLIDMQGYGNLVIAVTRDINDSEDVLLKALGEIESGGTLNAEIDGLSEKTLWTTTAASADGTTIYTFETDGIPYIQLQAIAGTLGAMAGDLTISIIKKY